jgi:2-methylcitrate dehydratase PrpD
VFIDTVGVIVLGVHEAPTLILRDFIANEGARPRSSILGTDLRTSPQLAALANGTAAHAIEFDDAGIGGHISAALVPAVLAVAEDMGASGSEVLTAFCIGFEVAAKVGRSLLGTTYQQHWRGWHFTPANAVMGCTAAAAYLLRLNQTQTAYALGHATMGCPGFRKNFGTMTKPYHCGHAAQAGIVAATLARASFTASADIFDGPLSYFDVLAEGTQQPEHLDTLGRDWDLLDSGVNVRLYPSCYLTVRTADAILRNTKLELAPDAIAAIDLHFGATEANTLVYDLPQTGLEAKFSAQYVVAAALLDGALTPASFGDAMVQRPAAQQLMRKIVKHADAGTGPVEIRIRTHAGEQIVRHCDVPYGSHAQPLDDATLAQKFRQCAAPFLDAHAVTAALTQLQHLRELGDIRALTAILQRGAH